MFLKKSALTAAFAFPYGSLPTACWVALRLSILDSPPRKRSPKLTRYRGLIGNFILKQLWWLVVSLVKELMEGAQKLEYLDHSWSIVVFYGSWTVKDRLQRKWLSRSCGFIFQRIQKLCIKRGRINEEQFRALLLQTDVLMRERQAILLTVNWRNRMTLI